MNGSQYIWILNGISLVLTSGALAGTLLQNVALNKNAVQSSQNHTSIGAGVAVDGKKAIKFESGSCIQTEEESDPWWRVDLQNVYKINAVTITNTNAQENGLNGAEIWIGNSLETNDPTKIRCTIISQIPGGRTAYIPCSAAEGRYVTVLLPGSSMTLTFCEVEVFPVDHAYPLPNLALKGDATQSSTLSAFAAASKAIDGRRNSFYSSGFCSHTAENESNPWWRVDLQQSYIVISVKVTNRGDCCAERLDGAEIRIGNSPENNGNSNARCVSISHIRAGKTNTYHCDGGSMEGRFVNVIIPGNGKTLTLCEVEVYGTPAVELLQNVAFQKPAVQSTELGGGIAGNVVSGCKSGNYGGECCSQTATQHDPWWTVDLQAVHKVRAVTIMNRRDCCVEWIVGAEIRIGNSAVGINNPRCGTISSDVVSHSFQCEGMEGRYVTVNIPGQDQILSLCEVEVFASPAAPDVIMAPPLTKRVQRSVRKVTVVGQRLCWSDALLFCRRHHWDLLSIRSREEQSEAEQLLSRSPFPLTHYVWLGLRRYTTSDRWFWMSGDSVDFTKWPRDSAPHPNSSPCGGMAGRERYLWEDRPCEELLNFICQSGAEEGAGRVYFNSTNEATTPQ